MTVARRFTARHNTGIPAEPQRDIKMPSLAATFRASLARQMEGYKERVAASVKRERLRHGQEVMEVAYRIGVDKRTYERWEGAETTPRLGNFQALADLWDVEISDLRPDLEAEQDQLQRLEEKVDELQEAMDDLVEAASLLLAGRGDADDAQRFEQAAEQRRERRQAGSRNG